MTDTPALPPSTATPPEALAAAGWTRLLGVVSLLAMIVLGLGWELWWAPLREGGSWWAIKVLPLTLPLTGLLKHRMYTYRWLSLLVWLYITEGLVRATSDTGLSQQLALVESVLASIYFISVLMFCRDTRPSLTNPELKRARRKQR